MESIFAINKLILLLLTIGLLISSLEYLKKIQIFSPAGLLSWNLMQLRWKKSDQQLYSKVLKPLMTETGVGTVLVSRCLILIFLFFVPFGSPLGWGLLCMLGLSLMATSIITFYGSDGSDQMTMLIAITLILCNCPYAGGPRLQTVGIWFIGLQSCLSYIVAGIAKLASGEWRASTAVKDIFSTRTYGYRAIALQLRKYPLLNVFLCWNVMLMETLFPLCLFIR